MERRGAEAIVIGASMSGLLAARVLADAYDRVTELERDRLPDTHVGRKGVPQGRHGHTLHPRGQQILDRLFDGFVDEIVADGAPMCRVAAEMRVTLSGGDRLPRTSIGIDEVMASRPFLEGHVRRRVQAIPNLRFLDPYVVEALVLSDDRQRIVGVRGRHGFEADQGEAAVLDADLVVAATGRSGRVPAWLESLGFPRPAEERLDIDWKVASVPLRMRPDALHGDKLVLIGARPGRPNNLALLAQEHGRTLLSINGYGEPNHPPTDVEGLLAFAASLLPPDLVSSLADAETVGEVSSHRMPANLRRRYDRLRRFPDGLLVTGDALCSFNPGYGQGMTVAALEAEALSRCLADGASELPRRFFRAATKIVDPAWQLAIAGDLMIPEVQGRRPLSLRAATMYLDRLQRAAHRDDKVAEAFVRTIGMLESPRHILRPSIALRVARDGRQPRRRQTAATTA